jgi:hypothetical protein
MMLLGCIVLLFVGQSAFAGQPSLGKPLKLDVRRPPAEVIGEPIDPVMTASPLRLTLRPLEQGTITWVLQVPASEPAAAQHIDWYWPQPPRAIPISGSCETYGWSIANPAVATWDGGGRTESPAVIVEVPSALTPLALPTPADPYWRAYVGEIRPGDLATIKVTIAAE